MLTYFVSSSFSHMKGQLSVQFNPFYVLILEVKLQWLDRPFPGFRRQCFTSLHNIIPSQCHYAKINFLQTCQNVEEL